MPLIKSDLDFESTARVLNLPDPTLAQHPATKAYVDSAVEGLAWKDSCRVSTQGNISIASPGATVDGITMTSGDRMLVRVQGTTHENGIYIWNGAATPATRAPDCSTAAELEQAVTTVEEGTSAGTTWRQTSVNFTLGSGAVAFVAFGTGVSAASVSMHAAGPTNAMPCASLRTAVTDSPPATSLSATGPTTGVMATMATYGSSDSAELAPRSMCSAPSK
jgi:hypothetical protein